MCIKLLEEKKDDQNSLSHDRQLESDKRAPAAGGYSSQ
jgi:hypothetical protein